MSACKHPSWKVKMYRDYGIDEDDTRFYYVACSCGLAQIDGKWQEPSQEMINSRRIHPDMDALESNT